MIRVTCAIIEKKEKVLITERSAAMSQPLLWEFPGGKIEAGETEVTCLVREIQEELNLIIEPLQALSTSTCTYASHTIELIPFICSLQSGEINLSEHASYQWVTIAELKTYDWCPADIPVVEEYIRIRTKPYPAPVP